MLNATATTEAPRFWIGVASADHVRTGVAGGFCQLGHGNSAPVKALRPGDGIVYYSPRETMADGPPLQSFTAIGTVADGNAYSVTLPSGFAPTRRNVHWQPAIPTPIRPLLNHLSFSAGNRNWGMVLRRGVFKITADDFASIGNAMHP